MTTFPTTLDTFTNPTPLDQQDSSTVPHAQQHANLNDCVAAIEAKIGVTGSSVVTSLDYATRSRIGFILAISAHAFLP